MAKRFWSLILLLVLISGLIFNSCGRNIPHCDENNIISQMKIMCYY